MRWYPSKVKQPSGRWRNAYAARINVDELWMIKFLLAGNPDRIRATVNRYFVNYGSRTNPVFAVADLGDVKRIRA